MAALTGKFLKVIKSALTNGKSLKANYSLVQAVAFICFKVKHVIDEFQK
jgi:hypothetical protein